MLGSRLQRHFTKEERKSDCQNTWSLDCGSGGFEGTGARYQPQFDLFYFIKGLLLNRKIVIALFRLELLEPERWSSKRSHAGPDLTKRSLKILTDLTNHENGRCHVKASRR